MSLLIATEPSSHLQRQGQRKRCCRASVHCWSGRPFQLIYLGEVWTAPHPPLHPYNTASCWLLTVLGNTNAHLRKQLIEHIRREEGHGALMILKRRTNVKFLAVLETSIRSEIGKSRVGVSTAERVMSLLKWMGTAQCKPCLCFSEAQGSDWVRNVNGKHSFSFLSCVTDISMWFISGQGRI